MTTTKRGPGAPHKAPELLKVPASYKLPRWLLDWLRAQDRPAAQLIEDALRELHHLDSPK